MNEFIKQILTGKDNQTYDAARVLWVLGVIFYLAISMIAVCLGQVWHPLEFGTGLSAVLAGGGIGVAVKSHTEPESKND